MMNGVSVIVPTYYRNERLQDALDSVQRQDGVELSEVVVVDNSEDGRARSVCENHTLDVIYLPRVEDGNAQLARSKGFEETSGEYIQFLDDDDQLLPGKWERQVEIFEENNEVGVTYGGVKFESGREVLPSPEHTGDVLSGALTWSLFPAITSTILVRREYIEEFHPFAESHGADDVRLKIELALRTEFDYVEDVVMQRGEPEYQLGSSEAGISGRVDLLDDYNDIYEEHPREHQRALAKLKHRQVRYELDENIWSVSAISDELSAIKHEPSLTYDDLVRFASSFFGRPGLRSFFWLAKLKNR